MAGPGASPLRGEMAMKKLLQRIRGAVGIGLTWAAGWAPIGAVTGWITAALFHFPMGTVITNYAVTFGVLGFIGGTLFSTVLSLADGRRSFNQLSLRRFAMWGALGGLLLGGLSAGAGLLGAGLSVLGVVMTGAAALLGAGSAAGMLAIARGGRGEPLLREGTPRALP